MWYRWIAFVEFLLTPPVALSWKTPTLREHALPCSSLFTALQPGQCLYYPVLPITQCLRMVFSTLLLDFHRGAHPSPSLPSKQKSRQESWCGGGDQCSGKGGTEWLYMRLSRGGGVVGHDRWLEVKARDYRENFPGRGSRIRSGLLGIVQNVLGRSWWLNPWYNSLRTNQAPCPP